MQNFPVRQFYPIQPLLRTPFKDFRKFLVPSQHLLRANIPNFNTQHVKFGSFLAERLVTEGRAAVTNPLAKTLVNPQAVVTVSTTNTEELVLTEDSEIVLAGVWEGFEPYSVWRCGS